MTQRPSKINTLLAGSLAGTIETTTIWPMENIKTQSHEIKWSHTYKLGMLSQIIAKDTTYYDLARKKNVENDK